MGTSAAIADFLDLMPSTVTVEPYLSSDDFGAPTFGPAKIYRAHIANKSSYVRGPQGETIVAKGTVWMATGDPVGDKDQITLPDGSQPVILAVNAAEDETGTLYVRVDFG